MKNAVLPTLSENENQTIAPEVSDEALLNAAKSFNESIKGHLRRSAEDFWRMGEALAHLYRRRHNKGRWADILAEIGISTTTDNHARRLYRDTTLEGLAEYKNRTAALRALGILSAPAPKQPQGSTPEVKDREEPESPPDHSVKPLTPAPTTKPAPASDDEADNNAGLDNNLPTAGHRPTKAPAQDNSLEVLAIVAARLEILAESAIDVTPDHLAQIDRAMKALGRLRAKGVAHAA